MISTTKSEINKGIKVQELYNIILEALEILKKSNVVSNDTQENPFLSTSSETFEPLGEIRAIVKQNIDVFEDLETDDITKIIIMIKRICDDTRVIYNRQRNFLSLIKPSSIHKVKSSKDKTKKSSSSEELVEFDGTSNENYSLTTEFTVKIRDFLIFIKEFYGVYNFSISPVQSIRVLLMGNICNAPGSNGTNKRVKKGDEKIRNLTVNDNIQNTSKSNVNIDSEDKIANLEIVDHHKSTASKEILQRLNDIKSVSTENNKQNGFDEEKKIYKHSKDNNSSNNSISSFTLSNTDLDHIESRSYIQNQKIDLANISDSAGPYVFNIFNALFNFQKNNAVTFYEVSAIFNLTRTFFNDSLFIARIYKIIVKEYVLYILRTYQGSTKIRVFESIPKSILIQGNRLSENVDFETNSFTNSFKTSQNDKEHDLLPMDLNSNQSRGKVEQDEDHRSNYLLFDGLDISKCKRYIELYTSLVARCCNACNGAFLELSLGLTDLNKAIFVMISIVSNMDSSYFAKHFTYRELFYCAIRSIYGKHHQKILNNEDFVDIVESLIRFKLNWKLADENKLFSMNKIYQIYFKSDYTRFIGKIKNTKTDVYKSLFYRFNYQICNRDLKIRLPNNNYGLSKNEFLEPNEEDSSRILITNVVHNTPKNNKTTETYAFSPFSRRIGEKTKDKDGFKSSRKLRFN